MCNESDYTYDDADDFDYSDVNATYNACVYDADANICANADAKDYANQLRFANDDHWNVIFYISDYSFINI